MAEKKSKKRRKDDEGLKPSKDETEVAKFLRFNLSTKKATLFGEQAVYFSGSSAVDLLMDSKWASGTTKSTVEFTHRESVSIYLQKMLSCALFSRVNVIKTKKEIKKKDGSAEKKDEKTETNKKTETGKDPKTQKDEKIPNSPKAKKEGKETRKVKKKVKVTLEVHDFQDFFDSDEEFYVWIYDPLSWKTFILGILLVLGAIVVCLFPLWPESVREYSWYLSVAGAIFVGGIIVLAVLRYIIYGMLWLATMGKLHFWLLPNLTAECGFFESFVPGYEYTVVKKEDSKKGDSEDERRGSETLSADDKDTAEASKSKSDIENIEDSDEKDNGDWVKVKKGDADD